MSKFYCLCMSPAIDATVTLKDAPCGKGAIFKDVVDVENVGGKTINVARWLALRGAEVACSGLLGEDNAVLFGKELAKFGVQDRFVRVPGSTRRNEMVVWPDGSFKINRAAFAGDQLVLINKEATGYDRLATLVIHEPIGATLGAAVLT